MTEGSCRGRQRGRCPSSRLLHLCGDEGDGVLAGWLQNPSGLLFKICSNSESNEDLYSRNSTHTLASWKSSFLLGLQLAQWQGCTRTHQESDEKCPVGFQYRVKDLQQEMKKRTEACARGRKRQLRQGGLARLRWSKLLITSKLCTKVEGSSSAEWELQVAELITSESPHPRPSTAGNRKWELVYQWLPNCRHYFDSNWNCGSWILGGVRGGVGGEWGRWGACVFYFSGRRNASYFSHNSLGLFSWLFSPISLFGAGSLTYF